jgi:glycosyltransferase involved in cell wall biosynthesis
MRCPRLSDLPPPPPGKAGWPWTEETPPAPEEAPGHKPWPRITIVTPSLNQGLYIEETIRSVLLQGYPDIEYMVLDGGSTDRSAEIIKRYSEWFAYWVCEKDDGQASAIHRGFERSTGQVTAWINSDDLYLRGCLQTVGLHFATHLGVAWACGRGVHIGPDSAPLRDDLGLPECSMVSGVTRRRMLYSGQDFMQQASFWTRSAYDEAGGLDRTLRFCFDYYLFLRLAELHRCGTIGKYLACFRHHPLSKTSMIQDVCRAEAQTIFRKRGGGPAIEKPLRIYYKASNPLRRRFVQAALLAGFHRPPAPYWAAPS